MHIKFIIMLTKKELKNDLKSLNPGTIAYVYVHGLLSIKRKKRLTAILIYTENLTGFHYPNQCKQSVRNPLYAFEIAKLYAKNIGWDKVFSKEEILHFNEINFLNNVLHVD